MVPNLLQMKESMSFDIGLDIDSDVDSECDFDDLEAIYLDMCKNFRARIPARKTSLHGIMNATFQSEFIIILHKCQQFQ